jgi:hypothetical protein
MATCSSKKEVEFFLLKVKSILNKPKKIQFIPRRKNLDALNKHGLSIKDIKFYIKRLEVKDYFKGPTKDRDRSGYVWEFGKMINNTMFYIKIKIKKEKLLCCLSFHDAQYKVQFPYN